MRHRWGRILAWALAIGLLGYLFWKIPLSEVMRALHGAAPWGIPVMAGMTLVVYLADSLAMWKTFGWFVVPLAFREVLVIRGATYLLGLVNYALGQGGIVYFVHRSRGVPVVRGAAAVLLIMGINLLVLLFLSTAGLATGGEGIPALRTLLIVGYVGLAIYAVAVVTRPRFLTSRPVFDVLLTAGISGYLKALVVRVPHVLTLVVLTSASLRAFGVAIPIKQALLCLPVVFLVTPFSVQGLGTMQAAMIFFFARYAPGDRSFQEASVLVASLVGQFVALVVQAAISLVCLRSHIARELKQATPATS
jgi:hypothetical protein